MGGRRGLHLIGECRDVQSAAPSGGEFHDVAVGDGVSPARGCGSGGSEVRVGKEKPTEGVSCLVRLSRGNASECRVWRLPDGLARAKSRIFAEREKRNGGNLRGEDWVGVVGDRDGPGGGLRHFCIPFVRGESSGGSGFPPVRGRVNLTTETWRSESRSGRFDLDRFGLVANES